MEDKRALRQYRVRLDDVPDSVMSRVAEQPGIAGFGPGAAFQVELGRHAQRFSMRSAPLRQTPVRSAAFRRRIGEGAAASQKNPAGRAAAAVASLSTPCRGRFAPVAIGLDDDRDLLVRRHADCDPLPGARPGWSHRRTPLTVISVRP